jgi:hypothetical protein
MMRIEMVGVGGMWSLHLWKCGRITVLRNWNLKNRNVSGELKFPNSL